MKQILALFLLFFLPFNLLADIDRSKVPTPGPAPVLNLKEAQSFKLSNGLTVLVVENHKLPRAYARLMIDNPPVFEGKKVGVSTLLSALLANGTQSIPKDTFNEEVDFMGASLKLSATGGYASSLSRFFPRILELMADALQHPLFDESEFKKQQNVLLDSIKSNEKNIESIASRVADKLMFGNKHPYGEFISQKSVMSITLKDVQSYYKTYVKPNRAYLIVVGDVSFENIKTHIIRHFESWKPAKPRFKKLPKVKNPKKTVLTLVNMPSAVQSNISAGNTYQLEMNHPDFFALKLANQILGGSATARLFMNLREDKGYTYGSYSSASVDPYMAYFQADASVRTDVTKEALVELVKEIKNLSKTPVLDEELNRAKQKLIGSFIMSTENPSSVANFSLNTKVFKLPKNFYKTYIQSIQAVTKSDIQRVAKKYFLSEKSHLVVVGNLTDIHDSLTQLPYKINYVDYYAKKTKAFKKQSSSNISKTDVIQSYFKAIGGKKIVENINALMLSGETSIQNMNLKLVSIQAKPNRQSMVMLLNGNLMMKQVFDGKSGYILQSGKSIKLTPSQLAEFKISSTPFEEIAWLNNDAVMYKGLQKENGKMYHVLKINNTTQVYYNSKTGFKEKKVVTLTDPKGNTFPQETLYSDYRLVDNKVYIPYRLRLPMGPQVLEFEFKEVVLNPTIQAADFQ